MPPNATLSYSASSASPSAPSRSSPIRRSATASIGASARVCAGGPCRKRTRSSSSPNRANASRTLFRSANSLARVSPSPDERARKVSTTQTWRRSSSCASRKPRRKIAAAAAAGPALDQVAFDVLADDRLEAALEVVETDAPHRGVRVPRRVVRSWCRARPLSGLQPPPCLVLAAHGVAEDRRVGRGAALDAPREVLDPQLVLQVLLVEQRALEQDEVPVGHAGELLLVLRFGRVLVHHRLESHLLRELQELAAFVGDLESVEEPGELGRALESFLVGHEREAEVDGQHHPPEGAVVLGDEVVERGHDTVAGSALARGVVHGVVETAAGEHQTRLVHLHAPLGVLLPELLGDPLRCVVQVPPTVRPAHVVHDQQRQWRAGIPSRRREHLQLVVDRVPVVVTVDERRIHGGEVRQHVVADVAVERVPAGEPLLVFGGIECGRRIDDVQLRVGAEAIEHEHRRLAAERADLDDTLGADGVEGRSDDDLPEGVHESAQVSSRRRSQPDGSIGATALTIARHQVPGNLSAAERPSASCPIRCQLLR